MSTGFCHGYLLPCLHRPLADHKERMRVRFIGLPQNMAGGAIADRELSG